MKTAEVVALGAAGLLAYTLFTKSRALGSTNIYPAEIKNIRFDGATPIMTVGLMIQNTSNQQLIIKSLAANAIANGYNVGNMSSFTPHTIAPNSQTVYYVEIRLSLISMVQDIISAFQYKNFKQDIRLQGYINIDNYQLPLNLTYNVGL